MNLNNDVLNDKTIKHWIECKDHCFICGLYYDQEFHEVKIFDSLGICDRFCLKEFEKNKFLYLGKYTENKKKPVYKVLKDNGALEIVNKLELYDKYNKFD